MVTPCSSGEVVGFVVGDGGVVFQLLFRFGWVGEGIIVVDIVGRGAAGAAAAAGEPGNATLKLLVAADRVAGLLRWRLRAAGIRHGWLFRLLVFFMRGAKREQKEPSVCRFWVRRTDECVLTC